MVRSVSSDMPTIKLHAFEVVWSEGLVGGFATFFYCNGTTLFSTEQTSPRGGYHLNSYQLASPLFLVKKYIYNIYSHKKYFYRGSFTYLADESDPKERLYIWERFLCARPGINV